MNKEFVSYKQALALKELGFDEDCFGYYENQNKNLVIYYNNRLLTEEENKRPNLYKTVNKNSTLPQWATSAPLYQQAFRWFREKYKLAIDIRSEHLGYYTSVVDREKMMRIVMKPVNIFETYEEAEQACLDKLIEIIRATK